MSYTTRCYACAKHKLDERAQCFDCWKAIEDARYLAREQEIAARAQLKLANDLIEAAEAYDVFECAHFPEYRCQCGHVQAQLAKAWNLAKIAYDKGRSEYEAKRGVGKVPASHEAGDGRP